MKVKFLGAERQGLSILMLQLKCDLSPPAKFDTQKGMEKSSAYDAGYAVGQLMGGALMLILFLGAIGFFIFALVKACTRKTTGWIVTTVIMGVAGIGLAVVVLAGIVIGVVGAAKQAKVDKVMTSTDGRYTLSVPGSWKPMPELNDVACIESGNAYADRYAIVIVEDKGHLRANVDLAGYATYSAEEIESMMGDVVTSEPESHTVGVFPAIRHRITGTANKIKVAYRHTCVETPTAFCRILCWSLEKDEKSSEPIFDKVAASFVEKQE